MSQNTTLHFVLKDAPCNKLNTELNEDVYLNIKLTFIQSYLKKVTEFFHMQLTLSCQHEYCSQDLGIIQPWYN